MESRGANKQKSSAEAEAPSGPNPARLPSLREASLTRRSHPFDRELLKPLEGEKPLNKVISRQLLLILGELRHQYLTSIVDEKLERLSVGMLKSLVRVPEAKSYTAEADAIFDHALSRAAQLALDIFGGDGLNGYRAMVYLHRAIAESLHLHAGAMTPLAKAFGNDASIVRESTSQSWRDFDAEDMAACSEVRHGVAEHYKARVEVKYDAQVYAPIYLPKGTLVTELLDGRETKFSHHLLSAVSAYLEEVIHVQQMLRYGNVITPIEDQGKSEWQAHRVTIPYQVTSSLTKLYLQNLDNFRSYGLEFLKDLESAKRGELEIAQVVSGHLLHELDAFGRLIQLLGKRHPNGDSPFSGELYECAFVNHPRRAPLARWLAEQGIITINHNRRTISLSKE